ncbi:response regulator [Neptunitalea lumnitzerae]|uniref:Response regulator n=1 Tax=Neptunitalea lumnitzerae TaxID=2965509 RepID=A0ABQ5MIK5_9FLAO|nr:response regulator [Neptunitalea sp. Y10]GLB49177.1 response regulator [Neptunitalea sp. Y10]
MSDLRHVLLVDDDPATNFINRKIITDSGCADIITTVTSAEAALEFLVSTKESEKDQPDLILLDINMPGMNGWEFLEEYKDLDEEQKAKIVIVMLTTSLNPDDEERARKNPLVNGFKNKPLNPIAIKDILENYFNK